MLSIKLPSLLLALASAIGMFLLLRQWFSRSVAVLASAIMITTGQYLIVAQSGTTSIVYIFFSVWLLLAATMITRAKRYRFVWKILFAILAALSLYTPLSIYALVALAVIGIVHPHIRNILKRLSTLRLFVSLFIFIALLTPLILVSISHPGIIRTLLGVPADFPNITANIVQLFSQYFDFVSPSSGTFMTPIFSLGSMLLILLGLFDMLRTKYTARSYTIMAWLLLLLPIIVINPRFTTITFVPLLLLLAMGLQALIGYWYRLFPLNPYARIAGLLPLIVLVGGLVFSGVERYVYGYHYDPHTVGNFSRDLRILHNPLRSTPRPIMIVSTPGEKPFYDVIAKYNHGLTVSSSFPHVISETTFVTHDAHQAAQPIASKILTGATSNDANRFYIYKKTD
jgi:4-amino-4-deoxy-L-arabinose transferase-like glycosyltransferase